MKRGRQKQGLVQIVGAKTLSHEQHLKADVHQEIFSRLAAR
jgi:hypothetical protein